MTCIAVSCRLIRPTGRWCGRRDLNPHGLRHQNLNLACLPIPPRPPVGLPARPRPCGRGFSPGRPVRQGRPRYGEPSEIRRHDRQKRVSSVLPFVNYCVLPLTACKRGDTLPITAPPCYHFSEQCSPTSLYRMHAPSARRELARHPPSRQAAPGGNSMAGTSKPEGRSRPSAPKRATKTAGPGRAKQAAKPSAPPPDYSIAAVDRALDLLEALARVGPAPLGSLADSAAMYPHRRVPSVAHATGAGLCHPG